MKNIKYAPLLCGLIIAICTLAACGETADRHDTSVDSHIEQTTTPKSTDKSSSTRQTNSKQTAPSTTTLAMPTWTTTTTFAKTSTTLNTEKTSTGTTPATTTQNTAQITTLSVFQDIGTLTGLGEIRVLHGAHQTRIVRTAHGTYAALATCERNTDSGMIYDFSVVKISNDGTMRVLFSDTCPYDAAIVNIAEDINGDVWVSAFPINKLDGGTTPETAWLALYRLDAATDKLTTFKGQKQMTVNSTNGYGYSQPIFDFANRKIYALYNGGNAPGILAWFTFDMQTLTWQSEPRTVVTDLLRQAYMYCFADGKGGVRIVANRDVHHSCVPLVTESGQPKCADYVWDQLNLITIPRLSETAYKNTIIHAADYSRGNEGIAPNTSNNQWGDAFLDSKGRLHILYTTRMLDYNLYNGHPQGVISKEVRHAIYEGTQCLYNEPISYQITDTQLLKTTNYAMRMAESTNDQLYIFAAPTGNADAPKQIEIYRAEDSEGKHFALERTVNVGYLPTLHSLSISDNSNNHTRDNTVDLLLYTDGGRCYTVTPMSLSIRRVARSSSVFRANRETDLHMILSILPFLQSRIRRFSSSRFSMLVPVIPSSA